MKRVISFLLAFAIIFPTFSVVGLATDSDAENPDIYAYSFVNADGKTITVVTETDDTSVTSSVYVDKQLFQRSTLNKNELSMYTEIFDSSSDSTDTETNCIDGIINVTEHKPISPETLPDDIAALVVDTSSISIGVSSDSAMDNEETSTESESTAETNTTTNKYALVDEPVENSGLSASGYNDGYYKLGSTKTTYSSATGYLYRKISSVSLGTAKTWTFNKDMALSAVEVLVSAYYGFTTGEWLQFAVALTSGLNVAYDQRVVTNTATYTYDYYVRVDAGNMGKYFQTYRVKTYWLADNETNGNYNVSLKSFDDGFSQPNNNIIIKGIDNYEYYHFSDTWNHWVGEDARWAWQTGYMNGITDTEFWPDSSMTRAQVATTLYRIAGSPSSGTNSGFSDVSSNQWFAKAVTWASKNGIVNGRGDGTFAPDDAVTRQEFVTMLYRFAGYQGKNTSITGSLNDFSDKNSVDSWAVNPMKWAIGKRIIIGDSDSSLLRPRDYAKRADVVTMVRRYCNL